jgi:hypothetical protein
LIEAPILNTPIVDCGCRQTGRPFAMGARGHDICARIEAGAGDYLSRASPYANSERRACDGILELCRAVVAHGRFLR